jgi:hypothetical protein
MVLVLAGIFAMAVCPPLAIFLIVVGFGLFIGCGQ